MRHGDGNRLATDDVERIMVLVTALMRSRRLLALAVGALLALTFLLGNRPVSHDGAEVVPNAVAPRGWKTIEYRSIQVQVPAGWERSDRDHCEFRFEHWGPPEPGGCDSDEGVAFYYSATFDPAHGPGLRRAGPLGTSDASWGGWISGSDDYDVYAAAPRRHVVEGVLDSVRLGAGAADRGVDVTSGVSGST